ncbi:FecR family protein [Agrobacterium sp. a22-2]|uniref:FecR family protein n=1 Tax=Agrobacterium sp. a22-2 TaxID=2283840 RepID=UPI0014451F09|nr:FecR family protein [Agrobacterium sp. a22-2]NKN37369.1 FecR family protein [Agrobacterium sp. a22-2]
MPAKGAIDTQKKRNREAADWILRNGNPNLSPADRARFKEWLEQDPENCRTYSAAERLMGDARRAIQSDPALTNIDVRPRNMAKPITVTLLMIALATGAFFALDGPLRLQADMIAGTDEMPVRTLEDGSVVQLNASSAITVDFTEERRVIRLLHGQAFFQVAHALERPFTVVAGEAKVTALGTAFDVRYGNDDTEVTVTENAVQIEFEGQHAGSVRVTQGEQAIFDYANKETVVLPVDGLVALAWKRGQIAVDNAPLSYVVEEMNRHFYGRIIVAGSALANRRVSGTIKVADTDDALAFVTMALGVKATRLGPLIVIRR